MGSKPFTDDAFHDGTKVLPSVLNWHNYLRNSARRSDTISPRVLDLIETEMLLENPHNRINLEELCIKLDDILLLAKDSFQKSLENGALRRIASDTLESLLRMDQHAPVTAKPIIKLATTRGTGESSAYLLPRDKSQPHLQSERVRKSERSSQIVIGKTANRERAIIGLGIGTLGSNGYSQAAARDKEKKVEIPMIKLVEGSPEIDRRAGGGLKFGNGDGQNIRSPSFGSAVTEVESFVSHTERTHQPHLRFPTNHTKGPSKETPIQNLYLQQENRGHNPDRDVDVDSGKSGTLTRSHDIPGANQVLHSNHSTQETIALRDTKLPTQSIRSGSISEIHDPMVPVVQRSATKLSLESYAVYKERRRLDMLWQEQGTLLSFLTFRSKIPQDDRLNLFILNRDIVGCSFMRAEEQY